LVPEEIKIGSDVERRAMSDHPIGAYRHLTRQQLQAIINEKLGNTLYWLSKAYPSRPRDVHSEKTLLEIMAGLQNMQRRVNRSLSNGAEEPEVFTIENEV
jgi:hypothetical protein